MIHCTKCSTAGCYLSLAVHFVTAVGIIQGGISWLRIRAPLITSYPDECYFRGEKKRKKLFCAFSFEQYHQAGWCTQLLHASKKWSNGAFICLYVCALLNMTQYEIDCCFPSGYKSPYWGSLSHYPVSFYSPILFTPHYSHHIIFHPVISLTVRCNLFRSLHVIVFGFYRNIRAPFKKKKSSATWVA